MVSESDEAMLLARAYKQRSFVSWRNFAGRGRESGKQPLIIHDVTLRDGEQQANVVFAKHEKLQIAHALAAAGVDRVEVGMVGVSEDDNAAIRAIAEANLGAEVWAIARAMPSDIRAGISLGVRGLGVILLANTQYCKVFGWSASEAVGNAMLAGSLAKAGGLRTTLLIADCSRMEAKRLEAIVHATTAEKVYDAIALMDTFGALNPQGTAHLVNNVREMTDLGLEFHAHNDFGLAAANALAALDAGADVIHTSVLGLGERAGNAALEEVVLAAALLQGRKHKVDHAELVRLANLVQRLSRVTVASNKAIVGTTYSQIQTGGVAAEYVTLREQREDVQWLFPFCPTVVGGKNVQLVVGKGSGRANVVAALKAANIVVDAGCLPTLLAAIKREAIHKHRVLSDAEVVAVAREVGAVTTASLPPQA